MSSNDARYAFHAEYFDAQADLIRPFHVLFFPSDGTVELLDSKSGKRFLKRTECPSLRAKDLFLGATITVFARQLKLVGYADAFTAQHFGPQDRHVHAVIPASHYDHLGAILSALEHNASGVRIVNLHMAPDSSVYLEAVGADPAAVLQATRGVTVLAGAPPGLVPGSSAVLSDCTCVVVKPHAVAAGQLGAIVDALLGDGFMISAMQMVVLEKAQAAEFLEVYRGVVAEFAGLVEELASGACVAMEVRGENVVQAVRQLVGPADPEMARAVRPKTIRARFGADKVHNAVHCTDLPEDGELECQYFFQLL